jgi:oxalate decarboxylase/phosphoglucose isomerase-like protein (cupin superfamily)
MSVDGQIDRVSAGDTVFIPEGAEHFAANDGAEPLRLFYVFARDAFSDVHYEFPGGK